MNCGRGSLDKLHGLWGSEFTICTVAHPHLFWPYMSSAWEWCSQPAHVLSCRPAATHEDLPCHCCCHHHQHLDREDVEWAKYKVQIKQAGIWCDRWNWIPCCKCMCWTRMVRPERPEETSSWRTERLFGAFQGASNDRPWDNYHRSALLSNGRHVGLCAYM